MPRPLPPQVRQRAVELVRQGTSVAQAAKEFGISASGLRKWLAQEGALSDQPEDVITMNAAELGELRRRNRALELEVQFLRRACVYFARESERVREGRAVWNAPPCSPD